LIQRRGVVGENDARARLFPPTAKQLEHPFDLGNILIRRLACHPTRFVEKIFSRAKCRDDPCGLLEIDGCLAPGEAGEEE
jgi:hypothetical protein